MTARKVVVVGAGIVGLAHAWIAAERGCDVTVLERHPQATGASIRNFGMFWPIGQPPGLLHDVAMASRARWLRAGREGGIWVNPCGSVHLAHHDDEMQVLREFHAIAQQSGIVCELLDRETTAARTPGANRQGLRGSLFSAAEACVNPRRATAGLAAWLATMPNVRIEFSSTATRIGSEEVMTADGRGVAFDLAIVCGGADIDTLYPGLDRELGLRRCKLQMMRTVPQPPGWKLGTHVASGLTLRSYANFAMCPTVAALKDRIARTKPELDRYGIHILASQNDAGEVILGDSHEYDHDVEPFDKTIIDQLMLRELEPVISLPDWTIAQRWHGIYAKHPREAWVMCEPRRNVHVVTGLGGGGMTLSFGLAELNCRTWLGD
jgi:FAD dependent oxidoreductase TIGR03364